MRNKKVWMSVVTDENEVIFSKVCHSEREAEVAIIKFLHEHKGYDSEDFDYAFFWIGENDLNLDLMVFYMYLEKEDIL